MSTEVQNAYTPIPLRVKVSDGSVAPEPLVVKRTAATREEILAGLSVKERMLVYAIVAALDAVVPIEPAKHLLQAFQDATGVSYVGSAWDEA